MSAKLLLSSLVSLASLAKMMKWPSGLITGL